MLTQLLFFSCGSLVNSWNQKAAPIKCLSLHVHVDDKCSQIRPEAGCVFFFYPAWIEEVPFYPISRKYSSAEKFAIFATLGS